MSLKLLSIVGNLGEKNKGAVLMNPKYHFESRFGVIDSDVSFNYHSVLNEKLDCGHIKRVSFGSTILELFC